MKKKILPLLLVLTLCLSLTVPAFAADDRYVLTDISINIPGMDNTTVTLTNTYLPFHASGSTESPMAYDIYTSTEGVTISCNQPFVLEFSTFTETQQIGGTIGPVRKSVAYTADATAALDFVDNFSYTLKIPVTGGAASAMVLEKGEYIDMDTFDITQAASLANANGAVIRIASFDFTYHDSLDKMLDDKLTGTAAKMPLLSVLAAPAVPAQPIAEVPSSWAADSVNAAIAAGIVPASLQSKYTQATTRAEFCALAVTLYEMLEGEIVSNATFTDTTDIYVEKAATIGVVTGVGDGKFAPDQKLTREQAATMLSRLANAMGKPLAEQPAAFADNASVSSWAADAVGQMQATGIMTGVGDNTFAPQADYTREQSILTMMRLFDIVK